MANPIEDFFQITEDEFRKIPSKERLGMIRDLRIAWEFNEDVPEELLEMVRTLEATAEAGLILEELRESVADHVIRLTETSKRLPIEAQGMILDELRKVINIEKELKQAECLNTKIFMPGSQEVN
jgi:hypothetical protein